MKRILIKIGGRAFSDKAGFEELAAAIKNVDAEVITYPQQPMVVDVTVSGDGTLPDDLALTHDFDDGVIDTQLWRDNGRSGGSVTGSPVTMVPARFG